MKQTLSYYALYVSYISKRLCCYNIVHLFEIVGNPTKTRLKSSLEKYLFEKKKISKVTRSLFHHISRLIRQ